MVPRVFHQTPRFSLDPAFSTPRVFHTPGPRDPVPRTPGPRTPAPRFPPRLIIESDSSQESTWCYYKMRFCCSRNVLFFIRILTFLTFFISPYNFISDFHNIFVRGWKCWKYLSLVRFAHSWEILSPLEDKIRIPKRPCNILYLIVIVELLNWHRKTRKRKDW